ncbi:alkaline phosphatase family protein [Fontimonas sp. SYSU GA230001]|uniref:alkaline phosphatase family protein n=1 Tax=Fontimonas sp. SYSU GA230001 TaxID=3142450 RepID=UPI0032B605E4
MHRTVLAGAGALLLAACSASGPSGGLPDPKNCVASGTEDQPPPIGHVFVIMLENKGYDETFGPGSPAVYLRETLMPLGQMLPNYHGTGHNSTTNYVAMVSGQSANLMTQGDCIASFAPWTPTNPANGGALFGEYAQAIGQGCVYPANVPTVFDELDLTGKTWAGWMQDMQFELKGDPGRDPARPKPGTPEASCIQPEISYTAPDQTNGSDATEQYSARHNPFVFFESLIGTEETAAARARCDAGVLDLERLRTALRAVGTTPNFNFIVPDNCHNAHDPSCSDGGDGGLKRADEFLREWVPLILASPAYQQDGLLIIVADEANIANPADPDLAAACCGQELHPGPNTPLPGIVGPGGGRQGALVISRYTQPGSVNPTPYNHFGFLRSVENIFGLDQIDLDAKPDDGYLGYAGLPASAGMHAFGADVYNCGG